MTKKTMSEKARQKIQKIKQKYSNLYKGVGDEDFQILAKMPIGCFNECVPRDCTRTKIRWNTLLDEYGMNFQHCGDVYHVIVDHEVIHYGMRIRDWVNLREALTFMMTKYWIGVPKDWGERPAAVQKRLDEAIARNTKETKHDKHT